MNESAGKSTKKSVGTENTMAAAFVQRGIFRLQDNRPQTAKQQAQVNALNGAAPDISPIQLKEREIAGDTTIQLQRNHSNRYMQSGKINHRINKQQSKQVAKYESGAPVRAKALEKSKRKKAAREKQKAEEARKRTRAKQKETYEGLGDDDAWKEIIDGRYHNLGAQTFDEGLHAPSRDEFDDDEEYEGVKADHTEEGYLQSMMNARAFVGNSLGKRVDAGYLEEVHRISTAHKREDASGEDDGEGEDAGTGYHGGYRNENDTEVHVSFSAGDDYKQGGPNEAIAELNPDITKAVNMGAFDTDPSLAPATKGDDANLTLWFKTKKAANVKKAVNKIMTGYYNSLEKAKNKREKLVLIASTHRKLENLHPFIDGNSRTNRLILHKMLVENGMSPVILENPLAVHLQSNEKWADTLDKGMKDWDKARKGESLNFEAQEEHVPDDDSI